MEHKIRTRPRKLLFNDAALKRLPLSYPKIPLVMEDSGRQEAGYVGEKRLDDLVSKFPAKEYHIFQGLRLPNKDGTHFQIDSFIYNSSHLQNIEVKNLSGEITIDRKNGQMIQLVDDHTRVYEEPLLQAEFQARYLRDWLISHGFPPIPIEPLVMMSNQNCILNFQNNAAAQYRICRGRQIVGRIEDISAKYKNEILSPSMIKKLNRLLLKEHCEPSYDIEKIYKIPRSDLLSGVHCPSCGLLGMIYHRGAWVCPKCGVKSKDARLAASRDYYLLFGPEITNQQFREFLGVGSVNIASKILCNLDLPHSEAKKNRVYQLSPLLK